MTIKLVLLGAVHGAILTMIVVLGLLSVHEDLLMDQIVLSVTKEEMTEQEKAINLVENVHNMMYDNFKIFANAKTLSFVEQVVGSTDINLLAPKGYCGSYAHVLARLLQRAEFDVRLAQMECSNGEQACHILVEAKIGERYVPLDAMYRVYFTKEDGDLATYQEVGKDWEYYSQQLPERYPGYFNYYDVRYTNWQKIPFFMPLVKEVMRLFIGSKVDEISIRSYVLNVYKTYFVLVLIAYLFLLMISVFVLRQKTAAHQPKA